MDITCQSCQQVLSIAGPTPSFCPFCGASLSKAGTAVKVAGALPETAVHEAETIPGSSAGALTEPQVSHAAPSQMVGDFRLLRELGQGGMGTVFEAEHQATGRRVALKLLST
ncbi:MAG: hypothetical protein HYS13_17360, partial [Planctomycetia bacterium]|nr:hypothetical protein [Planctomycetia bacterium]